jgi:hypothetical protein
MSSSLDIIQLQPITCDAELSADIRPRRIWASAAVGQRGRIL